MENPFELPENSVNPAHEFAAEEFTRVSEGKIVLQQKKVQYLTERPTDWLGGDHTGREEAETHQHKNKLKPSWQSGEGTKHKEDPSAEAGPEDAPTLEEKPSGDKTDSEDTGSLDSETGHEQIVLQQKKFQYLTERPTDWLGGDPKDREEIEASHLHKTKLRASWLHNDDEGMSQSLQDLSFDPVGSHGDDPLHASESQFFSGKKERRQTSPMILQRLSLLKKKSDENHNANDTEKVKSPISVKRSTGDGRAADNLHASDHQVCSAGRRQTSPMVMEKMLSFKKHIENAKAEHAEEVKHEEAEFSARFHAPKTEVSASWQLEIADVLSPSESQTKEHRKTSPMIMAKLTGLSKLNEEVHKKNENYRTMPGPHKPESRRNQTK